MNDSELSQTWALYEEARQTERQDRRTDANAQFHEAQVLAEQKGFQLIQRSEVHYQLRGGRWLINVYPGNQRIYADRQQQESAPYLELPKPWTLVDVVNAAFDVWRESEL